MRLVLQFSSPAQAACGGLRGIVVPVMMGQRIDGSVTYILWTVFCGASACSEAQESKHGLFACWGWNLTAPQSDAVFGFFSCVYLLTPPPQGSHCHMQCYG